MMRHILKYMKGQYNTKEQGLFNFLIYKEDGDYVAVCLNLDIVEYGKDPHKLMESIQEAAASHLEAVRKKNLPDDYLNISTDKKYLDILRRLEVDLKNDKEEISFKGTGDNWSKYLNFSLIPYTKDKLNCYY